MGGWRGWVDVDGDWIGWEWEERRRGSDVGGGCDRTWIIDREEHVDFD